MQMRQGRQGDLRVQALKGARGFRFFLYAQSPSWFGWGSQASTLFLGDCDEPR